MKNYLIWLGAGFAYWLVWTVQKVQATPQMNEATIIEIGSRLGAVVMGAYALGFLRYLTHRD